jgi:undecaprenyl-diphosphatase
MTLLYAAIFGVVEGITEFLPISSTGHLLLTAQVLHLPQTEAMKTFEIVIQLGAILAVAVLRGRVLVRDRRTVLLVLTAFLPTAVIGFLLHDFIKGVLLQSTPVLLWSFFLGGIVLILVDRTAKQGKIDGVSKMTFTHALLIGVFQSIALIPGVSRAGATIVGGELLGVRRATIVDFSFLLAIPTMAAATGYDFLKSFDALGSQDMTMLAVGFIISFIVALIAVRSFITFVQKHSLASFGIYRIGLAAAVWLSL